MVPTHMFLTKGVGIHKEKLTSFEEALRSAGIAYCNLVSVSSILPPDCKIIPRKRGEKLLNPGEITYCVMARTDTNERSRLISSSVGVAVPSGRKYNYGYLSEHHAYGETDEEAGEYTEDLAAQMLATTSALNSTRMWHGTSENKSSKWEEISSEHKTSLNQPLASLIYGQRWWHVPCSFHWKTCHRKRNHTPTKRKD